MVDMRHFDLNDLADELADFAPAEKASGRPASEERVIAGFEEIQRFVEKHGRLPQHGEDRDIFERLYACLLYTSPSPRDKRQSRMPSSA